MRQPPMLTYEPGNRTRQRRRYFQWAVVAIAIMTLAGWMVRITMQRPADARTKMSDVDRSDILDRQLPEVSFNDTPLNHAIQFLRDVTGARILVDWKHLALIGVTPDTPVTVNLRNAKFQSAMAAVVHDLALRSLDECQFEETNNGAITLTSQSFYNETHVVTVIYDIRDLVDEPRQVSAEPDRTKRGNEVVGLCTDTIVSDSWVVNGGSTGRIQECDGFLIVAQTPQRHRQVRELLEQLRRLYVGPTASGYGHQPWGVW